SRPSVWNYEPCCSSIPHLNHLVTPPHVTIRRLTTPMNSLPERISRLIELAYDLWWTWNSDARTVFRSLDYPLWRLTAHNPVRMLQLIAPDTLDRAIADPEWLANYDRAIARLDQARAAQNT